MKACHQCGTELPADARFCLHCGAPQFPAIDQGELPRLNLREGLAPQLRQWFLQTLRRRVEEEQPGSDPGRYVDRLRAFDFQRTVDRRLDQLSDEIRRLVDRSGADHGRITPLAEATFDELIDFFLIHQCKDLNVVVLPEVMLKYPRRRPDEVDLYAVVLDFLDLSREEEDIYLSAQFLAMPSDKLRNAGRSFLFPEKDERIFLICDQSLFGSCREGFSFTERGLYWRAHLQKPQRVYYHKLADVHREREWIMINGLFFNANPSLNIKILLLLRRLKGWYVL